MTRFPNLIGRKMPSLSRAQGQRTPAKPGGFANCVQWEDHPDAVCATTARLRPHAIIARNRVRVCMLGYGNHKYRQRRHIVLA